MTKINLIKPNERLEDLYADGLMIIQNPEEYLFTSDAVALSKFVSVKRNAVVVDLCSGSGVIGLLIYAKHKPAHIHMVELQTHLADMSKRSVDYNNLSDVISVHNMALQGVRSQIGSGIADVVVCNPPYKSASNKMGDKHTINVAKFELTVSLEDVISESAKLLKFGGKLCMVNKIERLTDMMVLMRKYNIEPKRLKFLSNSVLLEGSLGGKSGLKLEE